MVRIAKIKLNEHKSALLHWEYVVDVYETDEHGREVRLLARTYTDSILMACAVAVELADSFKVIEVEV